jgi:hypothetical protein
MPPVDASIAPPAGEHVVFHGAAKGTQNYACMAAPSDGGASAPAWTLKGPDAVLGDCHAAPVGKHFASEAGPPEWQLADGTFVVARKTAAFVADHAAVPWLLLSVDAHGGSAPLAQAKHVVRVRTVGGVAPQSPCDAKHAGEMQKVPYEADYFFYAP